MDAGIQRAACAQAADLRRRPAATCRLCDCDADYLANVDAELAGRVGKALRELRTCSKHPWLRLTRSSRCSIAAARRMWRALARRRSWSPSRRTRQCLWARTFAV